MAIDGIHHWLTAERSEAPARRYAHLVLREDPGRWGEILAHVRGYFRRAHDDVVRHMRSLAGVNLHPLRQRLRADPARHYPCRLHGSVLKGYFGEVFAGLLAEHFGAGGQTDWQVPAFLFRNHRIAFQQLERYRQTGDEPGPIPGRFGDDCLAFRRNARGAIVAVLYCEAKCTEGHDTGMVGEAHEKLSSGAVVDVLQLVEVLEGTGTNESQGWITALRKLHLSLAGFAFERMDLLCYICGQHPRRKSAWLRTDRPHENYQVQGRHLEAVEVHLNDVNAKVSAVYSEGVWT